MKNLFKKVIILLISCTVLYSCEKNDINETNPKKESISKKKNTLPKELSHHKIDASFPLWLG